MKEATLCPRLSLQQRLFNLVREDCEMTVEPVKQLALGLVRGEIADQGAFGCVFSELFNLRQVVLHRRCPPSCSPASIWEQRESIQTNELGHSDNATPPSVETVAGGAESLSREGLTKSRVHVGHPAAPKVHSKMARQREPAGERNGNYRTGGRTKQVQAVVRGVNELLRLARDG
jgi:hypothetical protein